MKSSRQMLKYLATAFVLSTAIAGGIGYFVFRHFIGARESEAFDDAAARKWSSAVAKDLDELGATPFFAQTLARDVDPKADAGSYLNRRLPWDGNRDELPPVASGLELPPETEAKLVEWGTGWLDHTNETGLLDGVDFGWMQSLHAFRYWDVEATGPLADHPGGAKGAVKGYGLPGPVMRRLNFWVKLRLIAAIRGHDPAGAAADVEQMARLAMTTEHLVPVMIGVSWLVQLDKTAEVLKARGVALPAGVPAVSRDMALKARRALWAERSYVDLGLDDAVATPVVLGKGPRWGACAVLDERLSGLLYERPFLGASYPERFAALDALIGRVAATCRPHAMLDLWKNASYVPPALQSDLFASTEMLEPGQAPPPAEDRPVVTLAQLKPFPYALRAMGLVLRTIGRPQSFGPYETGTDQPVE